MAVGFVGIGIFYLFLLILSLVVFFVVKDDQWLQLLFVITFVVSLAFFTVHAYQSENFLDGTPVSKRVISLDDVDINNFVISGQESMTTATDYFTVVFDNINTLDESLYVDTNFCFLYNNSDAGSNSVRVVNGVDPISDYIYLLNNTSGVKCAHINTTFVKTGRVLGITCEDCSAPNPLSIPEVTGDPIEEIHIDKANPLSYTLSYEDPHMFYISANLLPYEEIKHNFFLSLVIYGLIILGFIMRLIVKFVIVTNEVVLR